MDRSRDRRLGEAALRRGYLTADQLRDAVGEQVQAEARGEEPSLAEVLLRRGWLDPDQVAELNEAAGARPEGAPDLPRYEILERVGQGATAYVFRARDRELGRAVAVKVLRDEAGLNERTRQRFQREAQAAARLSHPNVVSVHDTGEVDGRMYLVLELVPGRSLSELLGERSHELRPMLRLLEKTARGVAAAHAQGIVHRDLKPANILVTEQGEPKVADFGLAHLLESHAELTRTGTALGTPLYMSPEQVRGLVKEITPRTDVYALGAILYEILVGRPPHLGDTPMEIYGKIVQDDPLPPRRIRREIHPEVETICMKALEKDPARRYADAAAFAEDLRRHLEGEPVLARPPGPAARAVKGLRRHPTVAAIGAVTLAGLLGFAGILVAGAARHDRALREHLERGRRALEEHARGPSADLRKEIVGSFRSVLELDPAHREAKRSLAAFYFDSFQRAEREGDRRGMEANIELVRFFDDGTYEARLAKKGKVTLESDPPGAEAVLERRGEGIAPATRSLGVCPLREIDLPIGSYRVLFRKAPYPEAWRLLDVRWGEAVVLRANLQGVPDERLKEIYEEVKTPFKHGVVLRGDGGWNVDSPCVFRLGERWHMLYVRENGVLHETWLAESADLLDWKPKGRVLGAGSGGWDDKVLLGAMAFQDPEWGGRGEPGTHAGRFWISYAGGALDNRGGALSIGLASSKTPADPASWTRHPANPVLRAKAPGAHPFEAAGLLKNVIVRDDARRSGHPFLMVYEGSDLGGARRLGLAGSDDLAAWTRLGDGPLFDHGGGISGRPQIVRIGDLWVMFYFGAYWKPKGFDTFACSWDLQRWTTWGGPDLVAPSVERSYDDRLAHKPAVVKHGGVVYHFYCGDGGQGRVIALAASRRLQ